MIITEGESHLLHLQNDTVYQSFIKTESDAPKIFAGDERHRAWIRTFYVPTAYQGIPYEGRYLFPFWLVTIFDPSQVCDAQGLILTGGISPVYHEVHHDSSWPWVASVSGWIKCDLGGVPIDVEAYSIVDKEKVEHFRFEREMKINGLSGIGNEFTFGLRCIDYERSMPFYDYITGRWNVPVIISASLPRGMLEGESFKIIVRDKSHSDIIYIEQEDTKKYPDADLVIYELHSFIELTEKPETISLKVEIYRPANAINLIDSLDIEGGFTAPPINNKELLHALLGLGASGVLILGSLLPQRPSSHG